MLARRLCGIEPVMVMTVQSENDDGHGHQQQVELVDELFYI